MRRNFLAFFGLLVTLGLFSACTGNTPPSGQPTVQVLVPSYGTSFHEGEMVAVQSVSTDANGIMRVELYVDRQLANTQLASTAQGSKQMNTVQEWLASGNGAHTLVRAFNTANVSGEASLSIAINPRVAVLSTNPGSETPTRQALVITATPPPDAFQPGFPIITATPPPPAPTATPGSSDNLVPSPPPIAVQNLFTPTAVPTDYPTRVALTRVARQPTLDACAHRTNAAPSAWRIAVCDQFHSNGNHWAASDFSDESMGGSKQLQDDRYRWDVTALQNITLKELHDPDYYYPYESNLDDGFVDNFYASMTGKRLAGSIAGSSYGLSFRYNGLAYYIFTMDENKNFGVFLNYDDQWTTVVPWQETSAILPNQVNRLAVLAQGSHFTFFINDKKVGEADDANVEAGQVGFVVQLEKGEKASFDFDEFEIRIP